MIKQLLPITLLMFAVGCNNDLAEDNKAPKRYGINGDLYGDVTSFTITRYAVKNKLHGEELIISSTETTKLNENGHAMECYCDWDGDKIVDNTYIYNYDGNGYPKNIVSYDEYNKERFRDEYVTDSRGNIILEESFEDGASSRGVRMVYDDADNLIELSEYNKNCELTYKSIYKYNESGVLLSATRYDEDGKLNSEVTNIINSKGKVASRTTLIYSSKTGDIDSHSKQEYVYNDKDQVIMVKFNDILNKEYTEEVYEYDSKGNVVKIKYYESEARILTSVTDITITYRK